MTKKCSVSEECHLIVYLQMCTWWNCVWVYTCNETACMCAPFASPIRLLLNTTRYKQCLSLNLLTPPWSNKFVSWELKSDEIRRPACIIWWISKACLHVTPDTKLGRGMRSQTQKHTMLGWVPKIPKKGNKFQLPETKRIICRSGIRLVVSSTTLFTFSLRRGVQGGGERMGRYWAST